MAYTQDDKNRLMFNYLVLEAFRKDYYKGLISENMLGMEAVIKIGTKKKFIYPVRYNKKLLAIPSNIIEAKKLPIIVTKTNKIDYYKTVYHLVNGYNSVKLIDKKEMSFQKMVDTIGDFFHSKKDLDFLIYKIICFMLYFRKGFVRGVSEGGFGKNSIPGILKILMTDITVVNPRTTAAFEHKLLNRFIILDEFTNLENKQRDTMQQALLSTTDGSTNYEKGSRGSEKIGTFDQYDISNLGMLAIYNVLEYYKENNTEDKYFDYMFQPALKGRFLPLYFSGILDATQFTDNLDAVALATAFKEPIKKIIRTIKYYDKNLEKELRDYRKDLVKYRLSENGRWDQSFNLIRYGIDLYCEKDDELYKKLVNHLYLMHKRYLNMMKELEIEEEVLDDESTKTKPSKQKELMY